MPGQGGQRQRMPEQDAVQTVVRGNDIQQPGDRRLLEFLSVRRMNPRGPSRRKISCHYRSITCFEQIL
jgi:hypothetical protein